MGRECKMSEAVSSVRIPAGSAVKKTLTVGIPRACALDSMVDEMLIRKNEISHIPMLTLTLDAESGMAGVETRLESFIDIIKMNRMTTSDR